MDTKIHYGQTHIFTNRNASSEIQIKAGVGERLLIPELRISSATVGSLNVNSIENVNITNATMTNLNSTNAVITSGTVANLNVNNLIVTNETCTNLVVTSGTISRLAVGTENVTSSTITNLTVVNSNVTNQTTTNQVISVGTIGSLISPSTNLGSVAMTGILTSSSYINVVQPSIYFAGGEVIAVSGSNTKLTGTYYNDVTTYGSCTFSSATGYFTVPVTGIYAVNIQAGFTTNTVGDLQFGIEYNNQASVAIYADTDTVGIQGLVLTLSTFLTFETGINYNFYVYRGSGTASTVTDARVNRGYIYYLP